MLVVGKQANGEKKMRQLVNFFLGGIGAYLLRLVITPFFKEIVGLSLSLSYAISLFVVIIYGYIINSVYIFRNKENPKEKFVIYVISILIFYVFDWGLLIALSKIFPWIPYVILILFSTGPVFIFKFLFYRNFVFVDYGDKGGNLFDKFNSKNPIVEYLMQGFTRIFLGLVTANQGKTMVDIGCGEGHMTNLIQPMTLMEIDAFEYDEETVKLANKLYPHLNVMKGDIMKLTQGLNPELKIVPHYDLLVSSEVLEHIEDYEAAIKNCKEVAKVCIFSVPREPFFHWCNIARFKYLNRWPLGNTPGHLNRWTKGGFRKLLETHFDSVEITTSNIWTFAVCK